MPTASTCNLRVRLRHHDEAHLHRRQERRQKRVAYAEGEEERACCAPRKSWWTKNRPPHADRPPAMIAERVENLACACRKGVDYDVVNVENDHRYRDFWQTYHRMTERKGVTVPIAKIEMRRRLSLIGAMLLHKGEVDGLICRHLGPHQPAFELHRPGDRQARRRDHLRLHERPDAA